MAPGPASAGAMWQSCHTAHAHAHTPFCRHATRRARAGRRTCASAATLSCADVTCAYLGRHTLSRCSPENARGSTRRLAQQLEAPAGSCGQGGTSAVLGGGPRRAPGPKGSQRSRRWRCPWGCCWRCCCCGRCHRRRYGCCWSSRHGGGGGGGRRTCPITGGGGGRSGSRCPRRLLDPARLNHLPHPPVVLAPAQAGQAGHSNHGAMVRPAPCCAAAAQEHADGTPHTRMRLLLGCWHRFRG